MPGEFEPIDAIMLGVNELIEYHPDTLAEIVAALDGRTGIIALVSKPDQERRTLELLRSRGVATDRIVFFTWPAESMWVQDFGPQQVLGDDVRVVDFEYAVAGREIDDQLPLAFAATFGMKVTHCHLEMEGGSLLSNGQGVCITSTQLIEQNKRRGLDLQGIGRLLNTEFGFSKWIYVMPLVGETTGHLDLFLALGGPRTVFLASYDPAEDRDNAARMDDNARTLTNNSALDGRPMEVIRIRQPAARDGCWRSYTNVIFGNGVVLVPQFPDTCPELDREALEVYRRAFPDRRIVGIDTTSIIRKRGGLHCLSLAIPRVPGLPRPDRVGD
jgi:agmatine deiminase